MYKYLVWMHVYKFDDFQIPVIIKSFYTMARLYVYMKDTRTAENFRLINIYWACTAIWIYGLVSHERMLVQISRFFKNHHEKLNGILMNCIQEFNTPVLVL